MNAVTFGDMLDSAERHRTAAERSRARILDRVSTVHEVHRLVLGMARCLDAVTAADLVVAGSGSDQPRWQWAATQLREALHLASDGLGKASQHAEKPNAERPLHTIKNLADAADALTAGNDLLHTHMRAGPDGNSVGRSDWAVIVKSQPIAEAMAQEMAQWSRQVASWLAWLTANGATLPQQVESGLAAASEWLSVAGAISLQAEPSGPAIGSELLRSFPLASPPEPQPLPPGGFESDSELCAGIAVNAERLTAIAAEVRETVSWSPDVSGPAWMRTAQAAAIASDVASLTLRTLAKRSARLAHCPADAGALREAADACDAACGAWQQAGKMWKIITTDTQTAVSPAVTEVTELVQRMGRLAYANPRWTPAKSQLAPPREPSGLAADRAAFTAVLSAVHQAAEGLFRMASSDLSAVVDVGDTGRLYMSNTVLWDDKAPQHRYVSAPRNRVLMLQDVYQVIVNLSRRAVTALDTPVLESGGPSKHIALARFALPRSADTADDELDLATIGPRLRLFGRPKYALVREPDIDEHAVLYASQHLRLTIDQCAKKFACSRKSIEVILRQHGVSFGPGRRAEGPRLAKPARPSRSAPPPQTGPAETKVRAMGVVDPGLLLRAAALDRAQKGLIQEAARETTKPAAKASDRLASSRAPRNAARLAAQDQAARDSNGPDPVPPGDRPLKLDPAKQRGQGQNQARSAPRAGR
jgi:hypothetical protein